MWMSNMKILYGTVESTNKMPDGTQIAVVWLEGEEEEKTVAIPIAGLNRA
jgi:hypothetical protein